MIKDKYRAHSWVGLLYIGAFSDQAVDKLEQEFQKLGVWDTSGKEKGAFQDELNRLAKGFSHLEDIGPESAFSKIYQTLEGLRSFAEG